MVKKNRMDEVFRLGVELGRGWVVGSGLGGDFVVLWGGTGIIRTFGVVR